MPKIFEYFGFVFFFYSNEHEPIHVHVTHKGCQSIFELIMDNGVLVEIRVREKAGEEPLSSKDQKMRVTVLWICSLATKRPAEWI